MEVLQSQYVAYLDGRIHEVAVDLYAQDDDGSVWYFGEDVFNYENGHVADTDGTWHAGVDGPAAMIMPADPQVGDVYRAENVPGVVFEQVTVKSVGKTVQGPTGPVRAAMVAEELHQEGDLENKTFAPGYGEFFSGAGRDYEANALTVPADARSERTPAELVTLSSGADDVFGAARAKDWKAASATVARMIGAWNAFRAGEVPKRLDAQMSDGLDRLAGAVRARNSRKAAQAAVNVARAGLDLQLRYRPPVEIDVARFELWARQLLLDAAAKNAAAVTGDVISLTWMRDRIALARADANRIDDQLRYLGAVADAEEFEVAAEEAARLREAVSGLEPTS